MDVQDYIDLMEAPTSAYDRVMLRHGKSPEARSIPSYSERPKSGILDLVPTREELRQGTFDVMHDAGFSPRASRKTAQTLFGTRSDSLDESAMPVPDIGAADFVTGAAAKRLIDPLLLTDAQTYRLDDEPLMAATMASLSVAGPAVSAIKGMSGASDQVIEDVADMSRRQFLKNAAGITALTALPVPAIKMAAKNPQVAAAAVKAAPVVAGTIKGLGGWKTALALLGHSKSYMNDAATKVDPYSLVFENMGKNELPKVEGISKEIDDMLGGEGIVVDFVSPTSRFGDADVPEKLYEAFDGSAALDDAIYDFNKLGDLIDNAKVIETRKIEFDPDMADKLGLGPSIGDDGMMTLEKLRFEDGTESVVFRNGFGGDDVFFSKVDIDTANNAPSILK